MSRWRGCTHAWHDLITTAPPLIANRLESNAEAQCLLSVARISLSPRAGLLPHLYECTNVRYRLVIEEECYLLSSNFNSVLYSLPEESMVSIETRGSSPFFR